MLTGCPLCRENHPLCRLKTPTVISIWLLAGFHPATWSVQSTPADNQGWAENSIPVIYRWNLPVFPGMAQVANITFLP